MITALLTSILMWSDEHSIQGYYEDIKTITKDFSSDILYHALHLETLIGK